MVDCPGKALPRRRACLKLVDTVPVASVKDLWQYFLHSRAPVQTATATVSAVSIYR